MLKHSISFSLHKRQADKNATGFPVRMRVSFNAQRPDFYTGITLEEIDWNPQTQRSYNRKGFENRELDKLETVIEEIFSEFEYELKRFPTIPELRKAFKIATNKQPPQEAESKPLLIYTLFSLYAEAVGPVNQWTETTYRKYNKIRNHFFLFDPELTVEELSDKTLLLFINYLQTEPIDFKTKKKKPPLRNSTVAKMFTDFMSVVKWASKEELYNGKVHITFKPKFKGSAGDLKDIIYLSWEELMTMFHATFELKSLEQVRDVFCFCCFTGLRFSDVLKLKRNHIKADHIVVATEKTIDPLRIELNDYSAEILKKYARTNFAENKALPVKNLNDYNEDLKFICKVLGFDEEINEVYFVGAKRYERSYKKYEAISSHAGRRTFVVNGLTLGISDKVIMKWTGHKTYSAMKPYVKIVDNLKEQEMKKFNKK